MPETFNFPFHRQSTRRPQEGTKLKLGNSWSYSSKPSSPVQRTFNLVFPVLKYYGMAGELDLVTDAVINLGALEDFYDRHGQHTEFIYPHPVYGSLTAKFNAPLEIPEGIEDGGGAVRGVTVQLIEIPT